MALEDGLVLRGLVGLEGCDGLEGDKGEEQGEVFIAAVGGEQG